MNICEQLYKKSLPLLEAYESDLMHDKDWIENNPGVPFMHYTRATGTHLIPLNPSNTYPPAGTKVKYLFGMADREYILQGKLEMQAWFENALREPPKLILHCDGRKLHPVTLKKAREILEDYARALRSQWELQRKGAACV
ncbi:hypothetical protein ACFL6U_31815 [Planctomycetota bacterium]